MHQQVVKFVGAEFRSSEMGAIFTYGATTTDDMAKQRPRLDSTRREGLETPFHEISDFSG